MRVVVEPRNDRGPLCLACHVACCDSLVLSEDQEDYHQAVADLLFSSALAVSRVVQVGSC